MVSDRVWDSVGAVGAGNHNSIMLLLQGRNKTGESQNYKWNNILNF